MRIDGRSMKRTNTGYTYITINRYTSSINCKNVCLKLKIRSKLRKTIMVGISDYEGNHQIMTYEKALLTLLTMRNEILEYEFDYSNINYGIGVKHCRNMKLALLLDNVYDSDTAEQTEPRINNEGKALIKQVCKDYLLTYADLGKIVGVSESSIRSSIYSGKVSNQVIAAIGLFITSKRLEEELSEFRSFKALMVGFMSDSKIN